MSAGGVLQAAVVAAVRAAAGPEVGVFDAPPVRGGLPYAVVEAPVLVDWSTKDWRGREGRIAVVLHDAAERPVRLRALTGVIEDAVEAVGVSLDEGWRLAAVRLARSRMVLRTGDRWTATSEFAVRLYRES